MKKDISVAFASLKLKENFEELIKGKFEDKRLHDFIDRAINDLKSNPARGSRISKKLWPKEYIRFGVTNLWKYNLPNAWRIIYTLTGNDLKIVSIILEWFDHKEYEKRFHYLFLI